MMACGAPRARDTASHAESEWFTDIAAASGLKFTHVNGMTGRHLMTEIIVSGVAVLDYDNDGDLDVFFVQSQGAGKLYRNNLAETGALTFTDVTSASGLVTDGYGMGVATGDFDNDGFVDLYVTNFGTNQLFHNNRNGTFTDVSKRSGTDVTGWSVSATFVDYDRDGWPDLFVGTYLQSRARRQRGRFQRRRLARFLRRQRQPAEPVVDQPTRRDIHERRAAVWCRGHGRRQSRSKHGRGRRRCRQRRRRRPLYHRADRRRPQPLYK